MSQRTESLLKWIKNNVTVLLQLLTMAGVAASFYLNKTYVSKEEMKEHAAAESAVHQTMSDNLTQLTKAVSKLEWMSATMEETAKLTRENTIRLTTLEERMRNVEREIQKQSK